MFKIAKRQAVPLMIGVAGPSGSGKTYSSLLMAAGIAGDGKIGFIDTEAGRGSMYADDPDIINAIPDGQYHVFQLTEPFTPDKYANAVKEAIKAGITVLVIDSASHEWEGFGGCQDIAENNKLRGMPNWAMAKMEHKRLMNLFTQCPMHVIFCLRAREKSRPMKNEQGKIEMVDCGIQPIQEKNFMYEMTLSIMLEDKAPGKPLVTKCPKPLLHLFTGEQAIITKEVGTKLKSWANGGEPIDMKLRNLKRECREAAMNGRNSLNNFFQSIDKGSKDLLSKCTDKEFQDEIKSLAEQADLDASNTEEQAKALFNKDGV